MKTFREWMKLKESNTAGVEGLYQQLTDFFHDAAERVRPEEEEENPHLKRDLRKVADTINHARSALGERMGQPGNVENELEMWNHIRSIAHQHNVDADREIAAVIKFWQNQ